MLWIAQGSSHGLLSRHDKALSRQFVEVVEQLVEPFKSLRVIRKLHEGQESCKLYLRIGVDSPFAVKGTTAISFLRESRTLLKELQLQPHNFFVSRDRSSCSSQ